MQVGSGAQLGFFRARGGLLEWVHVNKCFICDKQKKGPAGTHFGLFFTKMFLKLHFK